MRFFPKFLSRGRHDRLTAAAKRRPARLFGPRLETLEDRTVPSIVWTNRGQASDGFNSVFGSQASTARLVVDAALTSWDRVITNFNQLVAGNKINVEISMDTTGTDIGGLASITAFDGLFGIGNRPADGQITIGRGNDVNGDGLGDGGGWFLDPSPLDNSEFAGSIVNAFAGDAQPGSPAAGQFDLYTLVVTELTHVMGISSNPLARIHTPDHGTITDTGIPDDAEGGGVGRYFVFDGPSVTHLMTSNNGGPGGSDTGRLVHSAGPGGPSQPIAFPSAFRGNRQLFGADDISNAQFEPGRRYLVSEVPAQILKDAYTYTIVPPQPFGTFFAVLDQSTGNLLIRVGPGQSADNISLRR